MTNSMSFVRHLHSVAVLSTRAMVLMEIESLICGSAWSLESEIQMTVDCHSAVSSIPILQISYGPQAVKQQICFLSHHIFCRRCRHDLIIETEPLVVLPAERKVVPLMSILSLVHNHTLQIIYKLPRLLRVTCFRIRGVRRHVEDQRKVNFALVLFLIDTTVSDFHAEPLDVYTQDGRQPPDSDPLRCLPWGFTSTAFVLVRR